MTKDGYDRLVETCNQDVIVHNEAIKKLEALKLECDNLDESDTDSFMREINEWADGELLKVWSKYVLFCTEEHSETLLRKRRNIQTTGDYGEVDNEAWWKEIRYFLFKAIGIPEPAMKRLGTRLIRLVDPILDTLGETALPQLQNVSLESLSPYQYEALCAEEMRLLGYDVRMTKASGDQGIDVIARKGAVTIVLQCKMYSSPVGNKAVQEVYAGQKFNEADLAAVVSNHEFTESARQLAQALNVLLLHHSQLRAVFGEGSN